MTVSPPAALHHLHAALYALQVPIPLPMKTVTVLIDLTPPITLIDTALNTPEARQTIEDALAHFGLHWPDIERVIITHHHPDHYGLAGLIEERSGAAIQMLDVEIERSEGFWHDPARSVVQQLAFFSGHGAPEAATAEAQLHSFGWVLPAARLVPLSEGQTVPLAGHDWQVLWLPGHSDGHLGLWQPELDMLIAADAILPRITPNIGLYASSRPDPLGDYFGTLGKIAALSPARAVVGHHGPLLDSVADRANVIRDHHLERLDELRLAVRERPRHAYDLSFTMFARDLPPSGRRFALAETLAHAEHLRLAGEIERSEEGGVWVYHA